MGYGRAREIHRLSRLGRPPGHVGVRGGAATPSFPRHGRVFVPGNGWLPIRSTAQRRSGAGRLSVLASPARRACSVPATVTARPPR